MYNKYKKIKKDYNKENQKLIQNKSIGIKVNKGVVDT